MADPKNTADLLDAREGQSTGESHEMSAAEQKARSRRNLAIAFGVVGFVVLIYSTTILRLTQNVGTQTPPAAAAAEVPAGE